MKSRPIATFNPSPRLADYDAELRSQGWDTYVETFDAEPHPAFMDRLAEARLEAEKATGDDARVTIDVGVEEMQVAAHGARGGARYVLEGEHFYIFIRSPRASYCITVRYLAAGLWQIGLETLRARARAAVEAVATLKGRDDGEPVLSRFDYAFDVLSRQFTAEARAALVEQFICPSQAKWSVYGKGRGAQTFTVGRLPRLEVTLYDKSREVEEASQKHWFKELWGLPVDQPAEHVWRVEVRAGSEYLKDRNVRGYGALLSLQSELLTAAVVDRRLTDGDRERLREATMHPIFCVVREKAGAAMATAPIGRRVTAYRTEYVNLLLKQLSGTGVVAAHVRGRGFSEKELREIFAVAYDRAVKDPEIARRLNEVDERVRFIELAR
jgi:hypothetical protein